MTRKKRKEYGLDSKGTARVLLAVVDVLVGTFRRDLTDHLIVLGESHLLRCVRDYAKFESDDRPHLSLDGYAPIGRAIELPENGEVISLRRLGGLHHRYARRAA